MPPSKRLDAGLCSKNWRVCLAALHAIGDNATALQHAAEVATCLQHEHASVRWAALEVLRTLGPQDLSLHADGIAFLVQREASWRERLAGLQALRSLPAVAVAPHAQSVLPCLDDVDPEVRCEAHQLIAGMATAAINHSDYEVRIAVLDALEMMHAVTSVGQLQLHIFSKCLEDPSEDIRVRALQSLEKLPQDAIACELSSFVAHLDHAEPCVRYTALRALALCKPDLLSCFSSALGQCLDDKVEDVRLQALHLLERLEPACLASLGPKLRELLRDRLARIRKAAVTTLRNLPPDVLACYVDSIIERLADGNWQVRCAAIYALIPLDPACFECQALPVADLLSDTSWHVCCAAVDALGSLSTAAFDEHAPGLAELLESTNGHVCAAVIRVLAARKPDMLARQAHVLEARLSAGRSCYRLHVLEEILCSNAYSLLAFSDGLFICLDDKDCRVCELALGILANFDGERLAPYIPRIVHYMSCEIEAVRLAALRIVSESTSALSAHATSTLTQAMCKANLDELVKSLEHLPSEARIDVGLFVPLVNMASGTLLHDTPKTLLHYAAHHDCAQVVQNLLSHHAFLLHGKDVAGNTALHYAAAANHLRICKCLLRARACANTSNRHSQTAVDIARLHQHKDVLSFLSMHEDKSRLTGRSSKHCRHQGYREPIYRDGNSLLLRTEEKRGHARIPLYA